MQRYLRGEHTEMDWSPPRRFSAQRDTKYQSRNSVPIPSSQTMKRYTAFAVLKSSPTESLTSTASTPTSPSCVPELRCTTSLVELRIDRQGLLAVLVSYFFHRVCSDLCCTAHLHAAPRMWSLAQLSERLKRKVLLGQATHA